MRPVIWPGGWLERLALWTNLAPAPVAEAMLGMAISRAVMAGERLGFYSELAAGPASAGEVAARRGLDAEGARHLMDSLVAIGHLRKRGELYTLAPRARRWLDPASPLAMNGVLEFNYEQWAWWSEMEKVVRTGQSEAIHDYAPGDPRWESYITGMYELARLSAPEVARKLRLPSRPKRLLDVGGGHGEFAAALCRRHPGLRATVLDLPGSARVGRRIMEQESMADRVEFVEGNLLSADPGGPYDGALCFQVVHHLAPEQNAALFCRLARSLKPGGVLAVLDYFAPPPGRAPDTSALLGLHFCLTSASRTYRAEDLAAWLSAAGFGAPRRVAIRRIPVQTLYEAGKR